MTDPKPRRNMVQAWIDAASSEEFAELVAALGTSPQTLYQLSSGHRNASPARALQLENITQAMRRENRKLPALVCGDTSEVCRRCPHFQKSVGKKRATESAVGPAKRVRK
ncbi:MAG: hypothetical protein ACRC1H_10020 [Caldilineaceae bacterium]